MVGSFDVEVYYIFVFLEKRWSNMEFFYFEFFFKMKFFDFFKVDYEVKFVFNFYFIGMIVDMNCKE